MHSPTSTLDQNGRYVRRTAAALDLIVANMVECLVEESDLKISARRQAKGAETRTYALNKTATRVVS